MNVRQGGQAAAIAQAKALLQVCDHVLIAAGAGLSAAAGYDYADETRFAQLFPALHSSGVRSRYEVLGMDLLPEYRWGFWAIHTMDIRFNPAPSLLYQQVRQLVAQRDYFVVTSNVDQLFARNGFDPRRLYTPQGDYGLCQCLVPCGRQVWSSWPSIAAARAAYDEQTGRVSIDAIPRCPHCGNLATLNICAGRWFINDHFAAAREAFVAWLAQAKGRLVVLEIGAGFNTPSVVRWPSEHIVRDTAEAQLIRLNRAFPQVPPDLRQRSVSLQLDAADAIGELVAS